VTSQWYVLCCKPHKEQVILQQLQQMGFETYFPCSLGQNGKTGKLELGPYFPGYLFVRADMDEVSLSTFKWMPHTEGLVCFETKPAFVPDHLLRAVHRHVNETQFTNIPETSRDIEASISSIFDMTRSEDERVRGMLYILEGLSPPPSSGGEQPA
jgi:transcription antitermination factor NusG